MKGVSEEHYGNYTGNKLSYIMKNLRSLVKIAEQILKGASAFVHKEGRRQCE